MVELDKVWKGKIKSKAIFSFDELYRFCYTWFVDNDYIIVEKAYSEKINPNGKEIEISWDCKRKISDYFRFWIKITFYIVGMKEVEAEKEGAKVTMNKGTVEVRAEAILEKDYEHRWEGSSFFKFLRGLYDRYIIRGRIDQYEGKIASEVDEFLAQAKALLALEGKH